LKSSLLLILLCAAATAENPPAALQKLEIQSIEISEVSTDRIHLRVHLDGVADRDIHIRTLAFDDASINGVPVYPVTRSGSLRIAKGARFSVVEPLEATVFYRDLPSLEPVRRLVREEKALVLATVRLQPEFSLLQRIAMWSSSAWVSWKLERTVQVQIPGGFTGKAATELALAAADTIWGVGQRGLQWRRERDAFLQHVRDTYGPRVLVAQTRYTAVTGKGERSNFVRHGLVFHTGADEVLAPAEVVEPWMFDPVLAELLSSGAMEVVRESVDVRIGKSTLSNGALTVEAIGRDRSKGLTVERRKTYSLRDRSSKKNTARLRLKDWSGTRVNESTASAATAAVFRVRDDGSTEILSVAVSGAPGQWRLAEPVDSRAFGSPVIGGDGVLGILVNQSTILPLSAFR
jgi:hypothetical protein